MCICTGNPVEPSATHNNEQSMNLQREVPAPYKKHSFFDSGDALNLFSHSPERFHSFNFNCSRYIAIQVPQDYATNTIDAGITASPPLSLGDLPTTPPRPLDSTSFHALLQTAAELRRGLEHNLGSRPVFHVEHGSTASSRSHAPVLQGNSFINTSGAVESTAPPQRHLRNPFEDAPSESLTSSYSQSHVCVEGETERMTERNSQRSSTSLCRDATAYSGTDTNHISPSPTREVSQLNIQTQRTGGLDTLGCHIDAWILQQDTQNSYTRSDTPTSTFSSPTPDIFHISQIAREQRLQTEETKQQATFKQHLAWVHHCVHSSILRQRQASHWGQIFSECDTRTVSTLTGTDFKLALKYYLFCRHAWSRYVINADQLSVPSTLQRSTTPCPVTDDVHCCFPRNSCSISTGGDTCVTCYAMGPVLPQHRRLFNRCFSYKQSVEDVWKPPLRNTGARESDLALSPTPEMQETLSGDDEDAHNEETPEMKTSSFLHTFFSGRVHAKRDFSEDPKLSLNPRLFKIFPFATFTNKMAHAEGFYAGLYAGLSLRQSTVQSPAHLAGLFIKEARYLVTCELKLAEDALLTDIRHDLQGHHEFWTQKQESILSGVLGGFLLSLALKETASSISSVSFFDELLDILQDNLDPVAHTHSELRRALEVSSRTKNQVCFGFSGLQNFYKVYGVQRSSLDNGFYFLQQFPPKRVPPLAHQQTSETVRGTTSAPESVTRFCLACLILATCLRGEDPLSSTVSNKLLPYSNNGRTFEIKARRDRMQRYQYMRALCFTCIPAALGQCFAAFPTSLTDHKIKSKNTPLNNDKETSTCKAAADLPWEPQERVWVKFSNTPITASSALTTTLHGSYVDHVRNAATALNITCDVEIAALISIGWLGFQSHDPSITKIVLQTIDLLFHGLHPVLYRTPGTGEFPNGSEVLHASCNLNSDDFLAPTPFINYMMILYVCFLALGMVHFPLDCDFQKDNEMSYTKKVSAKHPIDVRQTNPCGDQNIDVLQFLKRCLVFTGGAPESSVSPLQINEKLHSENAPCSSQSNNLQQQHIADTPEDGNNSTLRETAQIVLFPSMAQTLTEVESSSSFPRLQEFCANRSALTQDVDSLRPLLALKTTSLDASMKKSCPSPYCVTATSSDTLLFFHHKIAHEADRNGPVPPSGISVMDRLGYVRSVLVPRLLLTIGISNFNTHSSEISFCNLSVNSTDLCPTTLFYQVVCRTLTHWETFSKSLKSAVEASDMMSSLDSWVSENLSMLLNDLISDGSPSVLSYRPDVRHVPLNPRDSLDKPSDKFGTGLSLSRGMPNSDFISTAQASIISSCMFIIGILYAGSCSQLIRYWMLKKLYSVLRFSSFVSTPFVEAIQRFSHSIPHLPDTLQTERLNCCSKSLSHNATIMFTTLTFVSVCMVMAGTEDEHITYLADMFVYQELPDCFTLPCRKTPPVPAFLVVTDILKLQDRETWDSTSPFGMQTNTIWKDIVNSAIELRRFSVVRLITAAIGLLHLANGQHSISSESPKSIAALIEAWNPALWLTPAFFNDLPLPEPHPSLTDTLCLLSWAVDIWSPFLSIMGYTGTCTQDRALFTRENAFNYSFSRTQCRGVAVIQKTNIPTHAECNSAKKDFSFPSICVNLLNLASMSRPSVQTLETFLAAATPAQLSNMPLYQYLCPRNVVNDNLLRRFCDLREIEVYGFYTEAPPQHLLTVPEKFFEPFQSHSHTPNNKKEALTSHKSTFCAQQPPSKQQHAALVRFIREICQLAFNES